MNGENALVAISGKVNFNLIKKNGETIKGKSNESFQISNGDKIDILSTINSVYGYFSIFGGFKIEEVKGSVSTLVKAKIGPNNGNKLKIDDKIYFKKSHQTNKLKKIKFDFDQDNVIRVMQGLQVHYFSKNSQDDFFSKEYKVTKLTDRMGMRLEGVKLENTVNKNIKSEGITKGSIQVPGDGQPIILLSDHPTIGGYPKIANVITADYDKLVQKTPGTIIKFKLVNLAVAENAFQDYVRKF